MLLLYAHTITPRLRYIAGFIGGELFDQPIILTEDSSRFQQESGPRINYSPQEFSETEFYLRPAELLFETGIRPQTLECFECNFHPAFFACTGDFPFDIFAASFFLLSRYEEYLPHDPDEYGRYPATASLAFREGFLRYPLVNIWLDHFRKALELRFPGLHFRRKRFRALVSYDIDIAWAYRHKGWLRNAGGFARSLLHGRWKEITDRYQVLMGRRKDPYDCYEWLDALHLYCRIQPHYFFLVAAAQKGYDKNTPASSAAFRSLIEYCAVQYPVGLHPSWQSGDVHGLLQEEKEWLEAVADKQVTASRQHYIRFTLPGTYRRLIEAGIREDYSMGYGSVNGFRASCCSAFYWYDLQQEETSPLLLYPFCFMDANSFFEQQESPRQAYEELSFYYEQVKRLQGTMVSVWHNNILGTAPHTKGWREMFEVFMRDTVYWDAYYDAG